MPPLWLLVYSLATTCVELMVGSTLHVTHVCHRKRQDLQERRRMARLEAEEAEPSTSSKVLPCC